MFGTTERRLEFTMTHRVGAAGTAERCLRPEQVRAVAERLQRWTVTPEACKSCVRLPAIRFVDELALCGACYAHRLERLQRAMGWEDRRFAADPDVRAESDPPATDAVLEGYSIRFNEKSVELFGFYEVIRPVAAERLARERPDVRALWSHDSAEPLGRTTAGTLQLTVRTRGVWAEITPPAWAAGRVETVGRGDITGQSFGFYALEDDWWLEDGVPHREILDMEVLEVSAVAFPAYPTTTLKAVVRGDRARLREQRTAEQLRLAR